MKYLPGQRWHYRARAQDEGSVLTILRVETLPDLGEIAFISVQGLQVQDQQAPGGFRTEIGFTELTTAALDESVTSLVDQLPVPDHQHLYDPWRRALDAGNTGVYQETVAQIVQRFQSIFEQRDRRKTVTEALDVAGWTTTFADPSLAWDVWDRKEDLLQLHHAELGRIADLGWYRDHFVAVVLQGDFQGKPLMRREAVDQTETLAALRELLQRFATA